MKTPVFETLSDKVASLRTCNVIKETPTQVFPSETWDFFKNTYFEEQLRTIVFCVSYGFFKTFYLQGMQNNVKDI